MAEVKVHLNDLEVITSGNAHVVENDVLKLNFGYTNMEIVFKTDKEIGEGEINYKVEDNTLKVDFINYKNTDGSGVFKPWRIGILEGRELFFTIFVRHIDFNSQHYYICNYIFYLGKEVDNGK